MVNLGTRTIVILFISCWFAPAEAAVDGGRIIFSAADYDALVLEGTRYEGQDPRLPTVFVVQFRQPKQITPNMGLYGAENPTTFQQVRQLQGVDCESMTLVSPRNNVFQLYDSADSLVGLSNGGYFVGAFDAIDPQFWTNAIRAACSDTSAEHPFRTAAGWYLVGHSSTSRTEIYERPNSVDGSVVEFWFVETMAVIDKSGIGSIRTLERIDCDQHLSVMLEGQSFDGPFARGKLISSVNHRDDASRLVPASSAPGTVGAAMHDAACQRLPKPSPKAPPQPKVKPKDKPPVEAI